MIDKQSLMRVDLSFLKTFTKGNDVKFKRYIQLYLDDAPATFERMRQNIAEENWKDLAINAHSLKPRTDFMGIASRKEVLVHMEEDVKDEHYAGLSALYDKAFETHLVAAGLLKEEIR